MKNPKQPHRENKNIGGGNKPTLRERFRKNLTTQNILVLITAIIAVTGIVQNWIARDTERRQLRAYLYVQIDSVANVAPNFYGSNYTIKNSGLTPAYNVRAYYTGAYKNLAPEMTFERSKANNGWDSSATSIAPNQNNVGMGTQMLLDSNRQWAILHGLAQFFIWGEITYTDIFNCQHYTRFRLYDRYPFQNRHGVNWAESGNEAN